MRVSLSETEWTGTVLLYFYRFSFCPQLPSNNTRQKKIGLVVFGAVLAVKRNVDGESAIMRKWKRLDHLLRNRRQFRISLPSSKLRNTGCPVTSKQCIHRLGPNEDPLGSGVVGLLFESDRVRLGFARRKIQIQPLREINVVWLKGDFCVLSVTTPVRPNSAIYTRKRYDEHLCRFLIGALPPPPGLT